MKVHAHRYPSHDRGGIVDGAILMHAEMSALLDRPDIVVPHDVTCGPSCLAKVRDGDVVYAGIGPYAFLYHLWRRRSEVDFAIVREVHTSFWSGYWSQEELCGGLSRSLDVALFPTEYTRRLYARWFPASRGVVAYPQRERLPRIRPRRPRRRAPRIGYLGALSLAKNFDQVLRIFRRVLDARPDARLIAAGKSNNADFEPAAMPARLAKERIPADRVHMAGVVAPDSVPDFLAGIDVLLFPSTASRETLGRVVLEALACGVPVLAADMGPAVELLPPSNRIPTLLHGGKRFSMSRCEPLGEVDEALCAEKILRADYAEAEILEEAPYGDPHLWQILLEGKRTCQITTPCDERILRAVTVDARTPSVDDAHRDRAGALFEAYFGGRGLELIPIIERRYPPGPPRAEQMAIASTPPNLSDYRAFPKLLDALVLPPLEYRIDKELPS